MPSWWLSKFCWAFAWQYLIKAPLQNSQPTQIIFCFLRKGNADL